MIKKMLIVSFAFLLGINALTMPDIIHAESVSTAYYENQLDETAKNFYQGLKDLYKSGGMKTGKGSIDMTAKGITQAQLEKYAKGDVSLATAFQHARDAFSQDYAEIFYVDFTKVSFRVGIKDNVYQAYINNGANEHYYAEGFSSKQQVETAITELESAKQELKNRIDASGTHASIIASTHNLLTSKVTYTYAGKSEDEKYVHSIYGALIKNKANCEGYSNALKWILDDYNIPTLLISGTGINATGVAEMHMWNYVQLENKWFAVDTTWDDPIGGTPREKYLLRGSDTIDADHFPLGEFSSGSMEFTYPQLNALDYSDMKTDVTTSDIDDISTELKISTAKDVDIDNDAFTAYTISYKDKDIRTLANEGLYIVSRFAADDGSGTNAFQPWVNLDDYAITNLGNASILPINKSGFIQFAVTKIARPSADFDYGTLDISKEENHLILSKKLQVPYFNNYVTPPFVRKATPPLTSTIKTTEKLHYKVEFDEELVSINEQAPSIEVSTSENHLDYKVENVTISNGSYTLPNGEEKVATYVEFDFTPDKTYQSYVNVYRLQVSNVVGKSSNKPPNSFPIRSSFKGYFPCPSATVNGSKPNAFVISSPTLFLDDKMDIFDYAGSSNSGSMNISLIASKPSADKQNQLDNALSEAFDTSKALVSSTFDLTLNCKDQLVMLKRGYAVTVAIPYPPGFDIRDFEGVEFKAFHFKKVGDKYVPEELICQITPLGLVVIVDSFSPFTIMAMEKDPNAPAKDYKTMNVMKETLGGTITTTMNETPVAVNGLYSMKANEQRFDIIADEGYVIDKLVKNGKELEITKGSTNYEHTFKFNDMEENNSLQVYFIAKSVVEDEARAGVTPITPVPSLRMEDNVSGEDTVTKEDYEQGELSSSDGSIVLSGKLLKEVTLIVQDVMSDVVKQAFQNYNTDGIILKMMDISLSKNNAYEDKLNLKFKVDAKYNEQKLTVLHYVNDKVEAFDAVVQNGTLSIETTSLSPFAIMDQTKQDVSQESDEEVSKLAEGANTGMADSNRALICIITISILIAGIAFVLKNKRRSKV